MSEKSEEMLENEENMIAGNNGWSKASSTLIGADR